MVVQYFGKQGACRRFYFATLAQAVSRKSLQEPGLPTKQGKIQVSLLGENYDVVVDERDDFGKSAFWPHLEEEQAESGEAITPGRKRHVPNAAANGSVLMISSVSSTGVTDVDYPDTQWEVGLEES